MKRHRIVELFYYIKLIQINGFNKIDKNNSINLKLFG